MTLYAVRGYCSLILLLLAASTLMAQPTQHTLQVFWEAPVDNGGQPFQHFQHYRVYICNEPIDKEGDKVVCHDGELTSQDVDKDQLGTTIVYRETTPKNTIYVRVTTINKDEVESVLSEQIEIHPYGSISLANSFFLMRASEHFIESHVVSHLWDRCTVKAPVCTSGSDQSNIVWIEFDFKNRYGLQEARLFGDAEGTWQSWSWSLSYKLKEEDPWHVAFTRIPARVNDWVRQELEHIPARYVRVEIFGDPETTTVQARELEILGIKLEAN